MEIKDFEIEELTKFHNEKLEEKIPEITPSLRVLGQKRKNRFSLLEWGGKTAFAYMFLILIFTFLSVFIIDSLSGLKQKENTLIVSADIFTAESSGSLVYAFRETLK